MAMFYSDRTLDFRGDYNLECIFELNSHMCMQNIFNGVIWFVLPVLLVAANDTFAYICGFFIGKKYIQVPLISLSVSIIYESRSDGYYNFQPKKSWEGFIGGGILTLIWGFIFAAFLAQFPLLICPVRLDVNWHVMSTCDAPEHFIPQDYTIPLVMRPLTSVLGFGSQVAIRPFQFHIVALGLFYIQNAKSRVFSSNNP